LNSSNPDPRLAELMTLQLFEFAHKAQSNYGTSDLVVILDLGEDEPELIAVRRSEMAASEKISANLRSKLAKPASEVRKALQTPHQSFWLLAIHSPDEMDCVAINASMLAPGGTA